MSEIERMAQQADFIVNGYSFAYAEGNVRVLNLNHTERATVLDWDGTVQETSMDDIELSIVRAYWDKNKQFVEE